MAGDALKINSEEQYTEVCRTVARKKKPGKLMRLLVNALESYRQARKLGWSRPWNKYNLNVFQSFKIDFKRDAHLMALLTAVLADDIPMPKSARSFYQELLADEKSLMGYIFIHEYQQDGELFEGATLSLGRVVDKKYRDRIDLIFESPVEGNSSQGFGRIRAYIDPFGETREPLWCTTVKPEFSEQAQQLFNALSDVSWEWQDQPDKHWKHWTAEYISYFGERQSSPENPQFYLRDRSRTASTDSDMQTNKERAA